MADLPGCLLGHRRRIRPRGGLTGLSTGSLAENKTAWRTYRAATGSLAGNKTAWRAYRAATGSSAGDKTAWRTYRAATWSLAENKTAWRTYRAATEMKKLQTSLALDEVALFPGFDDSLPLRQVGDPGLEAIRRLSGLGIAGDAHTIRKSNLANPEPPAS